MVYHDIYFTRKYGELYQKIGEGKLEVFEYESTAGTIRNMFIKREIPVMVDEKVYYDIITPYGYGGPMIMGCEDQSKKEKLVSEYIYEFDAYCKKSDIVSEFIRFHPINENWKDFVTAYDVKFDRKTVGTDLKAESPILYEYRKDCRKRIRKALDNGVSFEVLENPNSLDAFREVYYQTMDRNKADMYYYFNCDYFDTILNDFKNDFIITNALFGEKIIASQLNFIYGGKLIHSHLSGSILDNCQLYPSYILEYATTLWGIENKFDYIHHGGGRTNACNDTLYKYKRNFGRNTEFDFYIGEKVWNPKIYQQLCKNQNVELEGDYFPAYRSDLKAL